MNKLRTGGSFKKNDPRIYKGRKKRTYSQEVLNFIRANTADMSDSELSEEINRRFNLSTTLMSLKELRRYYGIMKGREKYKSYPALTERTNRQGYTKIKTVNGKWVNKHTFLYEQKHGKIPRGFIVIFLDGNKGNFSLENLAMVTKAEAVILTKLELRFSDPALTQTGIAIVKHKNLLMSKLKSRKNS